MLGVWVENSGRYTGSPISGYNEASHKLENVDIG
jgi:hypothetical protein